MRRIRDMVPGFQQWTVGLQWLATATYLRVWIALPQTHCGTGGTHPRQASYLAGVLGLSREIEEVVELILEASSREAAADQLKSDYGLSEIQALGILDMPLEQLTVDGLEALELEYRSYVN